MIAELERRAALESTPDNPVTALDVVAEYMAGGGTMRKLAAELAKATFQDVSPGILSSWANSTSEGKLRLQQARAINAANLVEEGMEIIDQLTVGSPGTELEFAL